MCIGKARAAITEICTARADKAIPLLARTGGLLAHLAEERDNPIGFVLAGAAEAAVSYRAKNGD